MQNPAFVIVLAAVITLSLKEVYILPLSSYDLVFLVLEAGGGGC